MSIASDTTLDNTINLSGSSADILIGTNQSLTLGADAEVNLNGNGSRIDGGSSGSQLTNLGTITAGGTDGINRTITDLTFDNQGTVEVEDGRTLNLFGNEFWTNSGAFVVGDSSSRLNLSGTFTTAGLGLVDNTAGGTAELRGTLINTGDTFALDATTGDILSLIHI